MWQYLKYAFYLLTIIILAASYVFVTFIAMLYSPETKRNKTLKDKIHLAFLNFNFFIFTTLNNSHSYWIDNIEKIKGSELYKSLTAKTDPDKSLTTKTDLTLINTPL